MDLPATSGGLGSERHVAAHADPFHAGPCLGRGAAAQGRLRPLPADLDVLDHRRLRLLAGAERAWRTCSFFNETRKLSVGALMFL